MMNEVRLLAPAMAAGFLLGAFFFGGLRWTVKRGIASQCPALWFFASMLLRMSITLVGFYLVGNENWKRWLLCLSGFVLARLAVQRLTRPPGEHRNPRATETRYAP